MQTDNQDNLRGLGFALAAYLMWGVLPLYMKAIAHIPAAEVIAHRVIWSVPIAGVVLWALRRMDDIRVALRTPRVLAMAAVTAALISLNWGIYVWSIMTGQALEAALGYYINPLFSILLGAVLLGEHLTRLQWMAISLAALAVCILTWETGRLPMAALGLTLTWGIYAFFKKSLPIGPNQGFLLEVLLLLPFALAYVAYLALSGQGNYLAGSVSDTWLLIGCGLITAAPLLVYANGAKLLRLSTIGILQYIAPTMIFLIAVFVFDEPFGRSRMIAFPMIWTALFLYSLPLIKQLRRPAQSR